MSSVLSSSWHADVPALLLGRRQPCMSRADCVEPGTNLGVERRSLASRRVHMKIDLFAGRNDHVVAGPAKAMKEMHALVIDTQQLCRYVQALENFGFGEMTDMSLDRVHG